ncbi:hypothetical protein [Paenisporosarcina sp. TG20]|uniref:hypothetical protein n=1 Tax=Paenisporosarcina sp. TG20 TaxID=1211706 RepID=UPI0002FFF7E7|nr:hypothetical protein [Paenisporosarcina sp. TG20]
MLKTKKSPVKAKLLARNNENKLVVSTSNLPAKIIAEPSAVGKPVVRKAGIRRNANQQSLNPNRRKMTVNVAESFIEIQKMNEKALKIVAKRA